MMMLLTFARGSSMAALHSMINADDLYYRRVQEPRLID